MGQGELGDGHEMAFSDREEGMRKLLAVVASMTFGAALGACAGLAASQPELLKAEPDLIGEISIRPVSRPLPARGAEASLKVHFDVKNTTASPIHLPVIEVRVIGADGVLRGYFGVQLTSSLAAGESSRYFVHSDAVTVRSDDTIVLVPVRPGHAGNMARPLENEILLQKLTPDQCDTLCSEKDDLCSSECNCGVKSFTCSCGAGGGYSYSCECLTGCRQ
jgi:hypothetical protein